VQTFWGATSATLDVADAAFLFTSSKVSVHLSLDLSFLFVLPSLPVFCCYTSRPTERVGLGKEKKKTNTKQNRSRESKEKRHIKTKRAPA